MTDDRILVMDSVTKLAPKDRGKVLVAASHGGVYAGYLAAKGHARGVILNDAGGGLDDAGFASLAWADGFGMPAATVDHFSARIGDGADMIANGVISHANAAAAAAGVSVVMPAEAAAAAMASGELWEGEAPDLPESRFMIRAEPGPRVIGCDSASLVKDEDAGQIVVCASHGGLLASAPGYVVKAPLLAVVLNDAGVGKDEAGIARVRLADDMDIAAAAVSAGSARIGDARSTWETGVLSHVNRTAAEAGGAIGMTTQAFVEALTSSSAARSGRD